MQKRWVIKEKGDTVLVGQLAKDLAVNETIASLLVQRGINSYDKARQFFRPELEHLHDPFLMKDMGEAVTRIGQALRKGENILVYGDYDVDGTTSVAMVYSFLKTLHEAVTYYIPDRYKEGYGISMMSIDFAADNDISLVIALDCGIKATDKIAYANDRGIDFIICDHHRPGSEIPAAIAVLDPKREDCAYPFKELSGCGVGFKLIQAYAQKNNIPFDEIAAYMDFVAVSIAADIVPIVDENRVLAHFGLKLLNSSPRKGFKAIIELANLKKEITINDIVFGFAPRINAAGRMESGNRAVELLISDSTSGAEKSGIGIDNVNTERRTVDIAITAEAMSMMEEEDHLKKKSTVLFNPEWHKGVVGIVASRLIEKYYRPTIVLTESNGLATGSARSVKSFDVYNAIEACSDLLEQFGGHMYAAGLTLKLENLEAFKERFERVVSSTISEESLQPEIEIDAELSLDDIDPKFFRIINQFAPFGPGNMSPVFLSQKLYDKGYARVVGTKHLKLVVCQQGTNKSFDSIAFGHADHLPSITNRKAFNACFAIEENVWNGSTSLQLNVKDLQIMNG
jgi:single-stranded-DNA-specific exonuclease